MRHRQNAIPITISFLSSNVKYQRQIEMRVFVSNFNREKNEKEKQTTIRINIHKKREVFVVFFSRMIHTHTHIEAKKERSENQLL